MKTRNRTPKVRTVAPRVRTLGPAVNSKRKHGSNRPMNRRDIERRRNYVKRHPLCQRCESLGITSAAVACDHVIPLSAGGADEWQNFQSLCRPCHDAKTASDAQGNFQAERYPQRDEGDYTCV